MLLRTFGGLSFEAGAGEEPVPAIGPRRLALLALVAAAGSRGITRDKILGILWPETGEEQARHTLSQTLYLLRRETGCDWITGASQLRLDAALTSDVGDFQSALAAHELERAATCYGGPFLEGFYLPAVPEFEKWVEETRSRLQFAALKALETLAARAAEAGAAADALQWWRRLGEIDPFNPTYAAGQIHALVGVGDQQGALRYAREYEARLQRELETTPEPVITDLIDALRSGHQESRGTDLRALRPPTPDVPPARIPSGDVVEPRARRKWVLPAAVGAALFAGVAWTIHASRAREELPLPFLAIGSIQSRDTIATGRILRDMLATNLARVQGMQVVSNSRLLELSQRERGTPDATVDAARRAGASELIEGEMGVSNRGLVLTLRRVALQSGMVRQGYSVYAADAYALIDSATAAIARDLGKDPPPGAVATVTTRSAIAYALYEQGLRAYYRGDATESLRLMNAALERDSTFAMAAFYACYSARALSNPESMRLAALARRLASRAVDRERLLILAALGREELPLGEHLAIARELTTRFPADPDGHIALGEALSAAGDYAGSVTALNRAITIDSAAGALTGPVCRSCAAFSMMGSSYLWQDSAEAALRAARRLIRLRPEDGAGWVMLVEPLLRLGRRGEVEAALLQADKLRDREDDFSSILDRDLIRQGRLEELQERYLSLLRTAQPRPRSEMKWLMLFALRNMGRLREAHALAATGVMPPGYRFGDRPDSLSMAVISFEQGHYREAARFFHGSRKALHRQDTPIGIKSRMMAWVTTLEATALAAAGDTATVRALADSVQRIGAQSTIGRDGRLPHFLHGLVLQRQGRHAEAVEAFRRALISVTDGYSRINLELANSLMQLQRFREATAILQPLFRGGVDGSNTYLTHAEAHYALAHAFEGAGQQDSARMHYGAVERAWRRADPEFAARYREARSKARMQ